MMPPSGHGEPGYDWAWTGEQNDWVPPGIDPTKAAVSRMYDHYLGGKNNYAVDREAADQALAILPDAKLLAVMNRQFLHLAVERMAKDGIRQFIDLGTGMPTAPNVHEVARRFQPDASVVYVDHDAVAATHARALLAGEPGVTFRQEDLRMPQRVLSSTSVTGIIDFSQPIGLLFVAVLHFVDIDLAPRVLARYRQRMPKGSQIAISSACRDGSDHKTMEELESVYASTPSPVVFRSKAQIAGLFDGFPLKDPGVVNLGEYLQERGIDNGGPVHTLRLNAVGGIGLRA